MTTKKEYRKNQRYLIIEDVSKVVKELKKEEIIVDLSIGGAKILSPDPKKINDSITLNIELPGNLRSIKVNGKIIRSKRLKIEKNQVYETGIKFERLNQSDSLILNKYISYLERNKITSEGRKKIKELLKATKRLKRNLLVLKCSLHPKK